MSIGASIDEVWADASSYASRAAPGTKQRAAAPKKKAPAASCAKSDPLCDLYEKGYSSAFDDIMDSYSAGDDMYDRNGYTRTQAALPGTVAAAGNGREVPDDDLSGMPGYDPSSMSFGDGAAPFSVDSTQASACQQRSPPHRPPRPPRPPPPAEDDNYSDNSSDSDGEARRKRRTRRSDAPAVAPTVVHVEQPRSAKAYATDAFDVALYIASGLILIFMMETFVQMGARMRY
jgi:hypothetical protein